VERSDLLVLLVGVPLVILLVLLVYDYIKRKSETHHIEVVRDERGRIVEIIERWY